jgi:hypothetical protein
MVSFTPYTFPTYHERNEHCSLYIYKDVAKLVVPGTITRLRTGENVLMLKTNTLLTSISNQQVNGGSVKCHLIRQKVEKTFNNLMGSLYWLFHTPKNKFCAQDCDLPWTNYHYNMQVHCSMFIVYVALLRKQQWMQHSLYWQCKNVYQVRYLLDM